MRAVKLDGPEITTGLDYTDPFTYLATMIIFRAVLDASLLGSKDHRSMNGENVSKYELLNSFPVVRHAHFIPGERHAQAGGRPYGEIDVSPMVSQNHRTNKPKKQDRRNAEWQPAASLRLSLALRSRPSPPSTV